MTLSERVYVGYRRYQERISARRLRVFVLGASPPLKRGRRPQRAVGSLFSRYAVCSASAATSSIRAV